MLELSAPAFGFLRCTRGRLYFAQVAIVAEIDNGQQWDDANQSVQTSSTNAADNNSRPCRTGEVSDRHPEEIPTPHVPDRLVVFKRIGDSSNSGVRKEVDQAHQTESDYCDRRSSTEKICS